jgi:hypothetical protein
VDEQEVQVQEFLSAIDFDYQQGMVTFTMKSNVIAYMVPPFDTNPLTMMWHLVITSPILVSNFLKYIKLAELAVVHIIGSVENERCLSTLAFMKSKFHNKLTIHFPIVMCMFALQFYILENFPYAKCIE